MQKQQFRNIVPNGWANGIHDAPYLEFEEAFEHIDGRLGKIINRKILVAITCIY